MNKFLFITLIVLILVAVLGVWIYLLFNGTPQSIEQLFTNLRQPDEGVERPSLIDEPDVLVNVGAKQLTQLTTKPVAGYVALGTTTKAVRYVEQGTGHIYEINLQSGQEERLSGTTLTRVVDAQFSPDGTWVVVTSESSGGKKVSLTNLTSTSTYAEYSDLANISRNHFLTNSSLYHTLPEGDEYIGYKMNLENKVEEKVFTTPLREIVVLWGEDEIFIYNKPSPVLRGGLYQIRDNSYSLSYGPGYGLTALPLGLSEWVVSYINTERQEYVSDFLNKNSGAPPIQLAVLVVPEKCAWGEDVGLWCALPYTLDTKPTYLSNWYQGVGESSDIIWSLDTESGEAVLAIDLASEAGFDIDVSEVDIHDAKLFFINRLNNYLWSYELRQE